jgi:hypothetical protein
MQIKNMAGKLSPEDWVINIILKLDFFSFSINFLFFHEIIIFYSFYFLFSKFYQKLQKIFLSFFT